MRTETGEERWVAPVEKLDRTFAAALKKSIKTPFSEPSILLKADKSERRC